ncbi:MAG: hypothetical protein JWM11_5421 [Planctomycetaceae bacterium]|nr:hypothetical protein [Planctomycetaceae bacterium]
MSSENSSFKLQPTKISWNLICISGFSRNHHSFFGANRQHHCSGGGGVPLLQNRYVGVPGTRGGDNVKAFVQYGLVDDCIPSDDVRPKHPGLSGGRPSSEQLRQLTASHCQV